MTPLRLLDVRIERFRGVPGSATVDFCDSSGVPQSVLLVGDNGSGKSTIVDAIEFALQGRVGRQPPAQSSLSPELISLSGTTRDAVVTVSLSDGTTTARRLERDADGHIQPSELTMHNAFKHVPLSLKRA